MLARLLSSLTAVLLLASCAAVVPGYSPPPFKAKAKGWTAGQSGDVDSRGTYVMSEQEKGLDCRRITGSIQIAISRLRDPYFRQESSALATGAQKTIAPIVGGSTRGADRDAEYQRERAKLDAYNRHLAEKNCKTIDIDAELAKPPEPLGKRY